LCRRIELLQSQPADREITPLDEVRRGCDLGQALDVLKTISADLEEIRDREKSWFDLWDAWDDEDEGELPLPEDKK
jgi:hypothetical protein